MVVGFSASFLAFLPDRQMRVYGLRFDFVASHLANADVAPFIFRTTYSYSLFPHKNTKTLPSPFSMQLLFVRDPPFTLALTRCVFV